MEIQKEKYVMVLMIDLSLAFDTLGTDEILPKKLKFYRADKKAIGFFDGFFFAIGNILQLGKKQILSQLISSTYLVFKDQ